jgi:hypothetical protein
MCPIEIYNKILIKFLKDKKIKNNKKLKSNLKRKNWGGRPIVCPI